MFTNFPPQQLIQNTKNRTRIYVFLGSPTALVDMMSSMDDCLLFAKGEYMVIFVDMMTYSLRYITTIHPLYLRSVRRSAVWPDGVGSIRHPEIY